MSTTISALFAYRKLKETLSVSDALDIASFLARVPYRETLARLPLLTVEKAAFEAVLEKLSHKMPVSYITNRREFFGLEFAVSPYTLIPRPETEILVEWVKRRETPKRILDLCTGSGNILITLLTLFPDACGVGVDISKEALETAELNAINLGVADRATFEEMDILTSVYGKPDFDLITANPPYLSLEEHERAEASLRYEPKMALTDGGDGLSFYSKIMRNYAVTAPVYFEIGAFSLEGVLSAAKEEGFNTEVLKDLAGIDRVVSARKSDPVG